MKKLYLRKCILSCIEFSGTLRAVTDIRRPAVPIVNSSALAVEANQGVSSILLIYIVL